jgi:hypothetical protein
MGQQRPSRPRNPTSALPPKDGLKSDIAGGPVRAISGHTESPARRRPSDGYDAKVLSRRFLAFVWLSLPCDMLVRGSHQN